MIPLWLNAIGFQAAWFVAVLGKHDWGLLAVAWILLHLYFCRPRLDELRLIATVMVIGLVIDASLIQLGVLAFEPQPVLIPLWLLGLWGAFSTALRHSLRWLWRYAWLAAVFGGVGAPLSYLAGERLGAVELPLGIGVTLAILMPLWALLMLALRRLINYWARPEHGQLQDQP